MLIPDHPEATVRACPRNGLPFQSPLRFRLRGLPLHVAVWSGFCFRLVTHLECRFHSRATLLGQLSPVRFETSGKPASAGLYAFAILLEVVSTWPGRAPRRSRHGVLCQGTCTTANQKSGENCN